MWYFGTALAAQTVPSAWADGPGASFGDNLYGQITPTNSPTYIANAAIVNAQIGGDIYSSNWNGSTAGWLLDRNGNFYANSGTFRGALLGATGTFGGELVAATGTFGLIRSATSGQRTEYDSNGIRIYNASGNLIVRLGVW
jgi:hypothetical protein